MKTSILVINEPGRDGKGLRDKILRAQIRGADGRSLPQDWEVLHCADFSKAGLKTFCDGHFDFVIILQAEGLTKALLGTVFQKLTKDGRAVAVYQNHSAALTSPNWVFQETEKVVLAQAQSRDEITGIVNLTELWEYLQQNT